VLDTTKSENTRKFALEQLKSIDEARFGRYDIEKGKLDGLQESVNSYTRAVIANAVAQKLSDRAGDALIARNSALSLFTAQEKAVDGLIKKFPNVQREAKKYAADLITTQGQLGQTPFAAPGVIDFLEASKKLEEYKKQLQDVNAVYRQTRTEAITATEESINLGVALNKVTEGKKGGEGKGVSNVTKKVKELKEELQGVIPLFDLLLPSKEQFNFDFLKEFFGPNFIKQLKESQRKINDLQKGIDKFKEGDTFGFLPNQAPEFTPSGTFTKELLNQKKLAKEFEDAKNIINDVFFAPVSDLFQNFFDTGKFAFEDFGKSILSTIKSIVSKIIATGIINLLANILFPGSSVAGNVLGGAATGAKGGIFGAFKAAFNSILGINKVSNPSFAGVGGGGMQLAGEVVFRQRGSDLIGVINRTNGTINRVG
jgi:hypothetical protein